MTDDTDYCEDDVFTLTEAGEAALSASAEPRCPWCNGLLFPKFSACFDCMLIIQDGANPPSTGWVSW